MTATDSWGISATTSVNLNPKTVDLTMSSSPPGLKVALNSEQLAAPYTRTVIMGSEVSVSASSPQMLNDQDYVFSSWSNGLSQNDTFQASSPTTLTATFICNPLMVNDTGTGLTTAGDCQNTLRDALAAASTNDTIEFKKGLGPITLSTSIEIPPGINLTGDCDSKQQIIASSSNKLSLQGNNALKGLDLLLNMPPDSPRALDLAGKQIQFEGCTSIQVVNS
jgi:hypothetical protein